MKKLYPPLLACAENIDSKQFRTKKPYPTSYIKPFLTVVLLLLTQLFYAQTNIYVSQTGGSLGTTGSDWDHAAVGNTYLASLANTSLPANTHIYLKAGNYTNSAAANTIFIFNDGIIIQGGFPTTATGTDLSGYNAAANVTTVAIANTATQTSGGFLTYTAGTNINFTLKGIQFTSSVTTRVMGISTGTGYDGNYNFTDLKISGITSPSGAIQLSLNGPTNGTGTFTNCFFVNNTSNLGAGAITGGATVPLTISGSSFSGNNSTYSPGSNEAGGGAIYSALTGTNTITNSSFCNNTYTGTSTISGGGAIASPITNDCIWIISGTTFSNNSTNLGGGGAIFCRQGQLQLTNCNFYGNKTLGTTVGGGAVFVQTSSIGGPYVNSVTNCVFYNNGCPNNTTFNANSSSNGPGGGAINAGYLNATNYTISNTKFVNNYVGAGSRGGAISMYNDPLNGSGNGVTLSNCLFSGNNIGGNSTTLGCDIIAQQAGGRKYALTGGDAMQLSTQASYLSNAGASTAPYALSGTNTFGNTSDGGVGTPSFTCPTALCNVGNLAPILK